MKILLPLSGLRPLSGGAFFAPPSEREAQQLEATQARGESRHLGDNARHLARG